MSTHEPLVTRAPARVGAIDWVSARPLGPTLATFVSRDSEYARRFAHRYDDRATWPLLAADRRPRRFDPALGEELASLHRRLGAGAASLSNVAALAEGRAFAVVAGQQPAPLGGPLYTWHKTMTAVALAARLEELLGAPVVPVFWNATEDVDFDEIAGASWAGSDLSPRAGALPRTAREDGRMVGALAAGLAAGVWHEARGDWHELPGSARVYALLDAAARAAEAGGDLGDVSSRLVLEAFAPAGIVVIDPRLAAFRRAALPLYERYVEIHGDVRHALDEAGDAIESLGLPRGFQRAQTEFALFQSDGAQRRRLAPKEGVAALERARATDAPGLVPGAALRPIAQDFVLPTLALVAGPGEIGYLAQLERPARMLGVTPAAIVPRWSATWLPRAALDACAEAGIAPADFVLRPDEAMQDYFRAGVPEELARPLAALRAQTEKAFADLAAHAPALDRSLPELVRATARRVDWRLAKLAEGFARKARREWKRARPEGPHLSSYVRPHGVLQERTLSWLDVVARGGHDAELAAARAAADHVRRALDGGKLSHDAMALEGA